MIITSALRTKSAEGLIGRMGDIDEEQYRVVFCVREKRWNCRCNGRRILIFFPPVNQSTHHLSTGTVHVICGVFELLWCEMSATWFREVCKVTVGDIVAEKRQIIAVEASTPVGTVLNLLKEENILSVPVYGTQGSWLGSGGVDLVSNHRQYIGIVSMMDLLSFILRGNPETVLNQRIVEAVGSTSESLSLWVEPASRPLYFALEQFCKGLQFFSVLFPCFLIALPSRNSQSIGSRRECR
jgi:hypothetical protein